MAWIKLDDKFARHPKIFGLSDAGFRAYVEGLCYAGEQLTDGWLPAKVARSLSRPKARAELIAACLWHEDDDGYRINDYLDFNPSRAKVEEERAKTAARVREYRGRNAVTHAVETSLNGCSTPPPVPDPTKQEQSTRAVNAPDGAGR